MTTRPRTVKSLENAIMILDIMMDNKCPMSLKALSAESGFPKSTISGYLTTLRQKGLVTQNDDGDYLLGNRLFEYGFSVYSSWDIIQKIHPLMGEVCMQTKRNCILAVDNHGTVMNVASWSSVEAAIGIAPYIGIMNPYHASAQGKVFLASYSDKKVKRILESTKLKKYTSETITDPDRLFAEIETVRRDGYAVNNGEYHLNNWAVSVPVLNKQGEVVYALGILDDISKSKEEEMNTIISVLKQVSMKITGLLSD